MSSPIGHVAIAERELCCNQGCKLLVPHHEVDERFAYYCLKSLRGELEARGTGSTFSEISRADLLETPMPDAALDVQCAIADFLDCETERIDALVAKKQRLIGLLQEKRTALISHAVTKGRDPDVSMEDSGVGWLGDVPAHWRRSKMKHVLREIVDTEHKTVRFTDDGNFVVARTSDIRGGRLCTETAKRTDRAGYQEWTRRGRPSPGDILFTREAPAGEACLVPRGCPVCLGQRVVLFRVDRRVAESQFLLYSLYAGLADEFIQLLSQGSTVAHFNMSDIGNVPVLVPPVPEQAAVARVLDEESQRVDFTIEKLGQAVLGLAEYRSALITAAVTGQIDVRTYRPREPEEVAERAEEGTAVGAGEEVRA